MRLAGGAFGLIAAAMLTAGCGAGPSQLPLRANSAWDPANTFAQIEAGRVAATIVYDDAHLQVIMNKAPSSPGHVVIVSKTAHARDLIDVRPAELAALMAMARRVIAAQRDGLGATGSTVLINNGSRQSIYSLHVHVIPQYPGSDIDFAKHSPQSAQELEPIAAKLRAALAAQAH